jgi:hypothetical protein
MNRKPDIVLTGRVSQYTDDPRELYLWEYSDGTQMIFSYMFSDWINTHEGYFMLVDGIIYFNRDAPRLSRNDTVPDEYRSHAYSNIEIRNAIENYLIEKLILTEH